MEKIKARQCMNPHCDGPEFWALGEDDESEIRHCPVCEFCCRMTDVDLDGLTAKNILDSLWAQKIKENHNETI